MCETTRALVSQPHIAFEYRGVHDSCPWSPSLAPRLTPEAGPSTLQQQRCGPVRGGNAIHTKRGLAWRGEGPISPLSLTTQSVLHRRSRPFVPSRPRPAPHPPPSSHASLRLHAASPYELESDSNLHTWSAPRRPAPPAEPCDVRDCNAVVFTL